MDWYKFLEQSVFVYLSVHVLYIQNIPITFGISKIWKPITNVSFYDRDLQPFLAEAITVTAARTIEWCDLIPLTACSHVCVFSCVCSVKCTRGLDIKPHPRSPTKIYSFRINSALEQTRKPKPKILKNYVATSQCNRLTGYLSGDNKITLNLNNIVKQAVSQ